jgi:hypothetical protein
MSCREDMGSYIVTFNRLMGAQKSSQVKRLHPDKIVAGSKATKRGKHTAPHIFACQNPGIA